MLSTPEYHVLQQVAALHHRSLPVYLTYARPWVRYGSEDRETVIEDIAADHHELVERILRVLEEDGRPVSLGDFPMAYTDLNDLSLDFILQELTRYEQQLETTLRGYQSRLVAESIPYGIVDYAVGMAQAHLQILQQSSGGSPAMRP